MYGFWRLGTSPAPSTVRATVVNGLATATSMKLKKVAIPPITGTTQTTMSRRSLRFSITARARVAGQHEQPEEQRALLPAPERRERVDRAQVAARVRLDVGVGEVVRDERADEHRRGDDGRAEAGDQGVAGGVGEPALPADRRGGAADEGVQRQHEADDECCATEVSHRPGSVRRRVLARALRRQGGGHERAADELPREVDVAADLEEVGYRAVVHDRDGRAHAVDVVQLELQAGAAGGSRP